MTRGRAPIARVLLVEDEEQRRDRLGAWLPADVSIVGARSAGQAIGLIAREPFDQLGPSGSSNGSLKSGANAPRTNSPALAADIRECGG